MLGWGCFGGQPSGKRKTDLQSEDSSASPKDSLSSPPQELGSQSLKSTSGSLRAALSRNLFSSGPEQSNTNASKAEDFLLLDRLGRVWLKEVDNKNVRAESLWQDKAALLLLFTRPGNSAPPPPPYGALSKYLFSHPSSPSALSLRPQPVYE
jgi:hypothetical protein